MHRTRAYRRSQTHKHKSRARRVLKQWDGDDWNNPSIFNDWCHHEPDHKDPRSVGMRARTRSRCSCLGCGGNPRRHTGERTVQERRHAG